MPDVKTVVDDLGSQAFKELVRSFAGQKVRTGAVSSGTISDAATGSVVFLLADEDLIVTDCLIMHDLGAVWSDVDTDLFIEHDIDLQFGSATAVLDAQGFNTNNHPAGLTRASDVVADAVATQTFPFLLPAGSALRARLVNNEGSDAVLTMSAKYHPADDLLVLTPDVDSGKVLNREARP